MTQPEPLTEQQLDEISARTDAATPGPWTVSEDYSDIVAPDGSQLASYWNPTSQTLNGEFIAHARTDVPALVDGLRRARDRVAELEAYAYGCDAEGCVLPHSSWCDAAKKTAAANDGCTCGKPWTGHPQPHAMHCWTVNPPRAEVEEMRKRIAELTAENAELTAEIEKLIRWHREDEAALAGMRGTIEYQRAEQAARTVPDARARRDAEVMRRCAAFVRDTYDGEWASDAAATLERDADVTEHGCPGYEDAGRGDTVAERQLANCKHCGRPRAVCVAAPAPTPAPLDASHGPAGARDGETGAEGAAGRVGDPRRTLTPNEYSAAWHAVEGAAGDEGADPGTVLHAVLDRLGIEWQDAARPAVATEEATR